MLLLHSPKKSWHWGPKFPGSSGQPTSQYIKNVPIFMQWKWFSFLQGAAEQIDLLVDLKREVNANEAHQNINNEKNSTAKRDKNVLINISHKWEGFLVLEQLCNHVGPFVKHAYYFITTIFQTEVGLKSNQHFWELKIFYIKKKDRDLIFPALSQINS